MLEPRASNRLRLPARLAGWPLALGVTGGLVVARLLEAHGRPSSFAGFALTAACGLTLAGRRRWPLAVFALALTLAVAVIEVGGPTGAIAVPAIVVLYGVAADGQRRQSLLLAAMASVVLALARGLLQPHGWSDARTAAEPVLVFAALFLGWAVSDHRAYVAEIEDRAARAEATREQEARRRVDAERLRIARELHDVLAHSIATISVQAGAAAHVIDDRPDRAREALGAIRTISKDALGELRTILGVLRQTDDVEPRAPMPGLDQLETLVRSSADAGVPARLVVSGPRRTLPASVDRAAYRIVQESLTNILRHAGPADASIAITYTPDAVLVEVVDDGGVRRSQVADAVGHGIAGMRERARALGGELEAGPRPDGGYRVHACLPVRADA